MKTIDMDVFAQYKKKIADLEKENKELRTENADLAQRLTELHGEYLMLRYQFKGLPSPAEFLKLRQEMQTLKKELRQRGWKDLV
jgi:predicted  nucleic acid-binding Zn-ribbon protein